MRPAARWFPEQVDGGAGTAGGGEDRLGDLLIAEVTEGLSPAEQAELDALLQRAGEGGGASEREALALAAAQVNLAVAHGEETALDPALRDKLLAGAAGYYAGARSGEVAGRIGPGGVGGVAGVDRIAGRSSRAGWAWLAAAAAVVLAVTGWMSALTLAGRSSGGSVAQSPEAVRAAVLAAADAQRLPWKGQVNGFKDVSGEVVWSRSRQEGVMVLRGLPANQPSRSQYQLWVVDPARAEQPVDGGVFDVTAAGEVLVPFTPRLPVDKVAAFAITAEKPGGVVVSKGPLLVVAGG